MSLKKIIDDYAAALEIVRRVQKNAQWSDMLDSYVIDEDTVAMADILIRELEESAES
jgi:hypothetical protein